jgi:hypothetical protein
MFKMLGSYTINVAPGKMPQKVASAFTEIFGTLVGAEYTPIAYLGSKVVSGVNHAIMASQTIVTGTDVHNVVLIVLNEKDDKFSLVEITTLLSDSGRMGGLQVAPTTNIPEEAMNVFTEALAGFMGSRITPFALLATQVVNGFKYVFACESTAVLSPEAMRTSNYDQVVLVSVYSNYDKIEFDTVIEGVPAQGALGAPLGEWP